MSTTATTRFFVHTRLSLAVAAGLTVVVGGHATARTQLPTAAPSLDEGAELQSEEQFLVGVVAPRLSSQSLWASGFAGYDGARGSSMIGADAEVTLTQWLALRAGFTYLPTGTDNDNLRPNVALRAQVLRQADHGVNTTASLGYRQERYVEDGGLLEALVSFGFSTSALTTVANLSYAQDPEADDFEGELRAAMLGRLSDGLSAGVVGRYRRDLGSTDLKRETRLQPDHGYTFGPIVNLVAGSYLIFVHGGMTGYQHVGEREWGVVGLAGLGANF